MTGLSHFVCRVGRIIADLSLPCVQISKFKLFILNKKSEEREREMEMGDGSGMGWVGGRLDSRVFANVAKTMCAAFRNYVIAAAVCEIGFCT